MTDQELADAIRARYSRGRWDWATWSPSDDEVAAWVGEFLHVHPPHVEGTE